MDIFLIPVRSLKWRRWVRLVTNRNSWNWFTRISVRLLHKPLESKVFEVEHLGLQVLFRAIVHTGYLSSVSWAGFWHHESQSKEALRKMAPYVWRLEKIPLSRRRTFLAEGELVRWDIPLVIGEGKDTSIIVDSMITEKKCCESFLRTTPIIRSWSKLYESLLIYFIRIKSLNTFLQVRNYKGKRFEK